MAWNHITTRIFGLLEIWLATEVYPHFPVRKGGFNMDTVVLGEDGIIKRYVDQKELDAFKKLVKTVNFKELLSGFEKFEQSVLPFFEKKPLDNRQEFMEIFRKLWVHEITAFFIGLYTEDQKIINIISRLRGARSAQHRATAEFLPKLYRQIAKAKGIEIDLLKYSLPEEIISLDFNTETLKSRRHQYVIESKGGKMRLLTGRQAENYTKKFLKNTREKINENISEIKGSPAFLGKVSGRVIVIKHEQELKLVKKGDILVAPMTRTSFLPAMKKAAAFITDEGGLTCHAAIIARELRKPCVVGTKIASRVLKKGMMVEVDANKGMIKIIN